jgi:hypothetical protein
MPGEGSGPLESGNLWSEAQIACVSPAKRHCCGLITASARICSPGEHYYVIAPFVGCLRIRATSPTHRSMRTKVC